MGWDGVIGAERRCKEFNRCYQNIPDNIFDILIILCDSL